MRFVDRAVDARMREETPRPQAVIVSCVRTPIGRAHKGSLVDSRPDDLAALAVSEALGSPGVAPQEVEDIILGCGDPAAEAGRNVARIVAILAGLRECPGTTVNRYCASSLQALRMAAHAIWSGEGEVFLVVGVESVSGTSSAAPTQGQQTPDLPTPSARPTRAKGHAPVAPASATRPIYLDGSDR